MNKEFENPPGYEVYFHMAGVVHADPKSWMFLYKWVDGYPRNCPDGPYKTREEAYKEAWKHYRQSKKEANGRVMEKIADCTARLMDRFGAEEPRILVLTLEDYRILFNALQDNPDFFNKETGQRMRLPDDVHTDLHPRRLMPRMALSYGEIHGARIFVKDSHFLEGSFLACGKLEDILTDSSRRVGIGFTMENVP